jgi:putative ABC transport system permease protein
VDLGFDPHNVITANFGLSETRYKGDKEDQFVTELLTRIRTIPGVVSVGATQQLPLANDGWGISFDIVERRLPPSQQPSAGFYNVTAGLLETMKIPIVAGRSFDEHDTRSGNPVMIINQAFAKKYFPNENPIGKQIEIGAGDGKDRQRWKTREIIGVVGNIRNSDLTDAPNPAYFVPYPQLVWGPPTLAIRTQGDPNRVVEPLHKILASMERDAPLYDIKTMEDYLALDLGRAKFQTVLLGFFASIALLLTAVGLYGVIAHAVALRTHEFGIRMALGASRTEVLAMVIKSGTLLTGIGLAIGVVGALALSRVLKSLLFDIGTRDPLTFASVCGLLAVVALLACYVPARRATSIDPMVALRVE